MDAPCTYLEAIEQAPGRQGQRGVEPSRLRVPPRYALQRRAANEVLRAGNPSLHITCDRCIYAWTLGSWQIEAGGRVVC